MLRFHVVIILISYGAVCGQDLAIELERVNTPSDGVRVTELAHYIDDFGFLAFRLLVENTTQYEIYGLTAEFVYKDSLAVPVHTENFIQLDGEGQIESSPGNFRNSVPPGTFGYTTVRINAASEAQRVYDDAVGVVISLQWSQQPERLLGDLDWDGDVDFDDFFLLADNFGAVAEGP